MLNSSVLEVGIGLLFCFSAVSLIVSSINEGISSLLKTRSNSLLKGIMTLLNDPKAKSLVLDLYNHAAINPHTSGQAEHIAQVTHKPSYIEPTIFARTLIEILQKRQEGGPSDIGVAIDRMEDRQLRALLQGMYARVGSDAAKFEAQLSDWFDCGMDRLGGAYKRKTQLMTVLIGFAVAATLNIDTFHLFKTLWNHSAMVSALSVDALQGASDLSTVLASMKGLPVGWDDEAVKRFLSGPISMLSAIFGWAVTALSTLFGAPFWFDLLQKATNLRSSGPKPKAAGQAALPKP